MPQQMGIPLGSFPTKFPMKLLAFQLRKHCCPFTILTRTLQQMGTECCCLSITFPKISITNIFVCHCLCLNVQILFPIRK